MRTRMGETSAASARVVESTTNSAALTRHASDEIRIRPTCIEQVGRQRLLRPSWRGRLQKSHDISGPVSRSTLACAALTAARTMHRGPRGMKVHLPKTETRRRLGIEPRRRSIRAVFGAFAIAAAVLMVIARASAQQQPRDATPFRSRTDLVTVGVTVAGRQHQFVTDLTA